MGSSSPVTRFQSHPAESRTFARQDELPKLPIPPLEETCSRYLRALECLQDAREHEETKRAVEDFLHKDGPRVQEKLKEYAKDKARCVIVDLRRRASTDKKRNIVLSVNTHQLHRRVLVRL